MKGGIYPDAKYGERCPICGGAFRHFEPHGVWCPDHPKCHARHLVVRFGTLTKTFTNYQKAYRMINRLRYETDQGSFDLRDYRRDAPLALANLVDKFINSKRLKKGVKKYEQRLRFAVERWQNRNVNEIGYAEIEQLLLDLEERGLSSKYRYDILCTLRMFWSWLTKLGPRGGGVSADQVPQFPDLKYHMPFRKIVTKEDQTKILEKIRERTWDENPRIYIGCLFLATYINMRPAELREIREGHIELEHARIKLTSTKEGAEKYVFLLEEDVELLRGMPKGFPMLHFFRHVKGNGAAKPGQQFGKDFLYREWQLACKDLGIEGVPLYPGTRHSTEVALREAGESPEAIWRAAGTRSNKARQRYLLVQGNELRNIYRGARPTGKVTPVHTGFITKSGVPTLQKTQ